MGCVNKSESGRRRAFLVKLPRFRGTPKHRYRASSCQTDSSIIYIWTLSVPFHCPEELLTFSRLWIELRDGRKPSQSRTLLPLHAHMLSLPTGSLASVYQWISLKIKAFSSHLDSSPQWPGSLAQSFITAAKPSSTVRVKQPATLDRWPVCDIRVEQKA